MRRGLSQGGRWLFKNGIKEGGGKACRRTPFGSVQRSLSSRYDAEPPPSPFCRSLTSDVSKIPNAPVGLPHIPLLPPRRKSKDLGQGNSDLSPTSPKVSGTRAGFPPQTPISTLRPPGARLPRTPTTPPATQSVRPAKVLGDCKTEESGAESPGPGQLPAALNLPRACVSAGPTWSLATRRIGGRDRSTRPAAARPSVRPWGRGRGLGGGGAGRGRRGEEGGGGEGRGPGAQEGAPRARGAIFFAFSRELLTSRLCN